MNGLSDIYTELIAEESRNPENRRHLNHPTHTEKGHNPSCGDEITLELEVRMESFRMLLSPVSAVPSRRHRPR